MSDPVITFDPGKCIECGACARDCISAVIELEAGKPVARRPELCNRCSHCVAVCPSGAVNHSALQAPERELDKKKLDPACLRETVMARRSVRLYKPAPPSREEIADLLDLARYSPTASNTMDVGYVVIDDPKQVDKIGLKVFQMGERLMKAVQGPAGPAVRFVINRLAGGKGIDPYVQRISLYQEWVKAGQNPVTHKAPVLILIHGPDSGRFTRENCAIAATNITNYATAKGLGTCYVGLVVAYLDRAKKYGRSLGIPEGRRCWLALTLGKPAVNYRHPPSRPEADVIWKP